jgi:hypothetical protein
MMTYKDEQTKREIFAAAIGEVMAACGFSTADVRGAFGAAGRHEIQADRRRARALENRAIHRLSLLVFLFALLIPATVSAQITSPTFEYPWAGTDSGSGIAAVRLIYSHNGGPWLQFGPEYTTSPITFDSRMTGGDGRYEFYTIGIDNVGNLEDAPTTPDWAVTVNAILEAPMMLNHDPWAPGTSVTIRWISAEPLPTVIWYQDMTSPTLETPPIGVAAGVTSHTVTGLLHNHQYRFRVHHTDPLTGTTSPASSFVYIRQDAVPPETWLDKAPGPMISRWRYLR